MNVPIPLPPALGTTIPFSGSVNVTTLGTQYKWNHTVLVLVCLTYFITKVHPCGRMSELSSFLKLNILLYVYTFCLSIHPSADIWVASIFRLL